ncbi:hypothetical protein A6770_21270 [Nostoc minutum NIES-26]|uniref:Uncharacterized protein n=2 Tax=Nostocaceae TaxID=1162 RepID=A0A367R0L9_9NOSO|nr:hypothetical protein A6770_21270 [Nostoc minutum NIES-26]
MAVQKQGIHLKLINMRQIAGNYLKIYQKHWISTSKHLDLIKRIAKESDVLEQIATAVYTEQVFPNL